MNLNIFMSGDSSILKFIRYINADLLWGLKHQGIKMMSTEDIILEIAGDLNTIYGQIRNR
ncbi:hypothetical protein C5471_09695 [Photorhabdus tasmaniensis]|uniref:Uncharacterized protein n=1 Tax=Photorhabdus tasmaniensis TaxID=1004159 RepID=A0ABX0GI69_9GAMM|nr:hypothetical protein [Photorhabdus tasmaniensis]